MEKFPWHSDVIADNTLITDSYQNTQKVRRYFKSRCGEKFKFDRGFMQWMTRRVGVFGVAPDTRSRWFLSSFGLMLTVLWWFQTALTGIAIGTLPKKFSGATWI